MDISVRDPCLEPYSLWCFCLCVGRIRAIAML